MFRRRSQLSKDNAGTSSRSFIRSFLSSSSTAGSLRSRSPSNGLDDSLPPYLDLSLPRTDLRVEFGAPGDLPKVVESSSAKVGAEGGRRNGLGALRKGSAPSAFSGRKQQGTPKDYLKFELAPVTTDPVPKTKSPPAQTDSLMFARDRPVTPPWAEEVLAAAPSNIKVDGTQTVAAGSGTTTAAAPPTPANQVHEGLTTPGVPKNAQAGFVAASTPTEPTPAVAPAPISAPEASPPAPMTARVPASLPPTPAPAPEPPLSVQATAPPPSSPARTTSFLRNLTPRSLRNKKSQQSQTLQQSPAAKNAELPPPAEESTGTPKAAPLAATTAAAAVASVPALAPATESAQEKEEEALVEQQTPKPNTHVLVSNVDTTEAAAAQDNEEPAQVPNVNGASATLTSDTATMNLHSDAGSMQTAEAGAETEIEDAGADEDVTALNGDSKKSTGQGLRVLDAEPKAALGAGGSAAESAPSSEEAPPQLKPVEVQKDVVKTVEVEERPEATPIEANGVPATEPVSHSADASTETATDKTPAVAAAAEPAPTAA